VPCPFFLPVGAQLMESGCYLFLRRIFMDATDESIGWYQSFINATKCLWTILMYFYMALFCVSCYRHILNVGMARTICLHHIQHTYVGLARTIYIRRIYGIFAGKSPNIRSYTVCIYGQPYKYDSSPAKKTIHIYMHVRFLLTLFIPDCWPTFVKLHIVVYHNLFVQWWPQHVNTLVCRVLYIGWARYVVYRVSQIRVHSHI